MNADLFAGALVRLAAWDDAAAAEAIARWSQDTDMYRLLDSSPARPFLGSHMRERMENSASHGISYGFLIRTLADDRLIGEIAIDVPQWIHGDSFVGISIGDPADRGRGYGTDAMRVLLRYAFRELNLQRVSLTVYEYNPRAIRSYEKAGFVVEGRVRQRLNREGRRWDMLYMGILRQEWEKQTETGTSRIESGDYRNV